MLSSAKSAFPEILDSWVAGTLAALPLVRVGRFLGRSAWCGDSPSIYADGTGTVAAPCACMPRAFPSYI